MRRALSRRALSRRAVAASPLVVSGCTPQLRRLLTMGHTVMLIATTGLTLVGLLALRATLRDLKAPHRAGHAALSCVSAIVTLSLPAYLGAIYGDGNETLMMSLTLGMLAFTLFLLVLFILALVRWARGRGGS